MCKSLVWFGLGTTDRWSSAEAGYTWQHKANRTEYPVSLLAGLCHEWIAKTEVPSWPTRSVHHVVATGVSRSGA